MMKNYLHYFLFSLSVACGSVENQQNKATENTKISNDKKMENSKLIGTWKGEASGANYVYTFNLDGTFMHQQVLTETESIDYSGTFTFDEAKNIITYQFKDCKTNSKDADFQEIAKNKKAEFEDYPPIEDKIAWKSETSFKPELNGIDLLTKVQ